MWKYINSNELYHAWPKGYKRGPDGTPLGYISKDSQYNDKERGTIGKISSNINTFKPGSTNYKVNTSGYKVNISDKKEKPPYEIVPINKNEVVPINKNEIIYIGKNKAESEIEKFNPTLDDIFDSTNGNTTKKGEEKVDDMFKNDAINFDWTEKPKSGENNSSNNSPKGQKDEENSSSNNSPKGQKGKENSSSNNSPKEQKGKENNSSKEIDNDDRDTKLNGDFSNYSTKKIKNVNERNEAISKYKKNHPDKLQTYADIANSTSSGLKNASQVIDSLPRKSRPRMNLNDMSDKELNDKINREILERRYNEIFSSPTKEEIGRQKVSTILNAAGTIAGVASSALGIALLIKQLKD